MPKQEFWFFVQETLWRENILKDVIIDFLALMEQLYIFRHTTRDGVVQNALLLRHRREKLVGDLLEPWQDLPSVLCLIKA